MKLFAAGVAAVAAAGLVGAHPVLAHDQGRSQGQEGQYEQQGQTHHKGASANFRQAQQKLRDAGYDPGPIDGIMGPKTSQALKSYQQAQNLPTTGHLDSQTAAALGVQAGGSATAGTRGSQSGAAGTRRPDRDMQGSQGMQGSGSETQGTPGMPGSQGAPGSRGDTGDQGSTY